MADTTDAVRVTRSRAKLGGGTTRKRRTRSASPRMISDLGVLALRRMRCASSHGRNLSAKSRVGLRGGACNHLAPLPPTCRSSPVLSTPLPPLPTHADCLAQPCRK
eukprot:363378-Chlamydomonas_euryale.AAC.10